MKLRNGNNQKNENTIQVGIMGIDIASEGPLSKNHKASYIFNYRYSTTGLLNLDGGTMDYQDLNFKLNFPTQKAGTFSVWGTSLIDKFKSDMEKNPEKWEYLGDRSESRDKQYMAAGGVSHRYFFNSDASLKTTVAATYSQLDGGASMFNEALETTRIIAVQDRNMHNVPPYAYNVCKIFVLCEILSGYFQPNIETTESDYFRLEELPLLAEEKNNEEQIKMCFSAYHDKNWQVLFE